MEAKKLSTTSQIQSQPDSPASATANYLPLRMFCWVVALALGAAQAWATRFTMNPDGISYLDIGDAYWRGDWHNAINAYWSPLYSWILGFFLKLLKPSAYWEYPLVHLVNFLIYVAALGCFEFFLATFIAQQTKQDERLSAQNEIGLPEWVWWVLGYSVFVSCSLTLITMQMVTPDMCVAAFVYLASALILKIREGDIKRRTFVALGVVLGFAYLAKAVMFPLGFVFTSVVAIFSGVLSRRWLRNAAFATVAFLALSSPFITAISYAKGRPTFGDSGKITYAIMVDRVDIFLPQQEGVAHPAAKFLESPVAYEFGKPISGTYPPWYDPTYWHDGIKPHFSLAGEKSALKFASLRYLVLLGSVFAELNFTVCLLVIYLLTPQPSSCVKRALTHWPVLVPALFASAAYCFVLMEYRYVAPFVLLLWLMGFSGAHLPPSRGLRISVAGLAVAASVMAVFTVLDLTRKDARKIAPTHRQAAIAMNQRGIITGNGIAVIADEPCADGGAFVARLAKVRIVAQTRDIQGFYLATPAARERLYGGFRNAGARAILLGPNPQVGMLDYGWERLAGSEYYIRDLSGAVASPAESDEVKVSVKKP